ncbi:MAG: HAMP domain-containing protein [Myxococcales bacterium]|nr:MAG: HAMP domain-containing protein [Myxococcales bacterium]
MLRRLPIRLKLILLAGVPVLGALILATLISRDAQRRAQSVAALGSIEDLARLSAHMSKLVQELQFERSELALRLGLKAPSAPELPVRFARTDAASRELGAFLAHRRVSTLPARLARDLSEARRQLERLPEERRAALAGELDFTRWSERYETADRSLISATAALAQLSDDGELMRAISALVTTMEIKERSSQEHALLSYVFAISEFPPGTFKQLVTLTTQEADYVQVLEVNASDAVNRRFRAVWSGPERQRAAELRKVALEAVDDQFGVDPREWSRVQGQKVDGLRLLEVELNDAVASAALDKVTAAQRALSISYSLGGSVIVVSALLAGWIAIGVSRSVRNLSRAAERVRTDKDFKVRAVKTSDDELGQLTDAFNEMLAGIQTRDDELEQHRSHLERLVEARTAELSHRNQAMRLVLDNVEQGLATIEPTGKLSGECSSAFDAWFPEGSGAGVAERLAQGDSTLKSWLGHGWEQVTAGIFPTEVALDQMPRRIHVGGRHYQLGYKPIQEGEQLQGVLLVVSDITAEMERLARDAEQRELIRTFEHLMRDRGGTLEFLQESENLIRQITSAQGRDRQGVLRALHTLKGNAGTFGVTSLAEAAHRLESRVIASSELPGETDLAELNQAWLVFSERMAGLLGTSQEPVVEVAASELTKLQEAARRGAPARELSALLARLELERASVRLRRIQEQARSLAGRLGKASLVVQIEAHGDVRFDRQRWAAFWATFVHPVRNALDHGIEPEAERLAAGKPSFGTLRIAVREDAESITIELSDDGRGVDFEKVRAKAQALGLPHQTEADLTAALFWEGLTTVDRATELSGRGLGMSALLEATRGLSGEISVRSVRGRGTALTVRFPQSAAG